MFVCQSEQGGWKSHEHQLSYASHLDTSSIEESLQQGPFTLTIPVAEWDP